MEGRQEDAELQRQPRHLRLRLLRRGCLEERWRYERIHEPKRLRRGRGVGGGGREFPKTGTGEGGTRCGKVYKAHKYN
jgi:hypothetical protein